MRRARTVLLSAYGIAYVVWFFWVGLPADRITVTIALLTFVVIGRIGAPASTWRVLPLDVAAYALMWLAYDETRGLADRLGLPLQVESVRNIDRFLFLGTDPTVWLQRRFLEPEVRFYDVIASLEYFSHFLVPVAVIAVLWVSNRHLWLRFMRRFATVLTLACAMFVLLPTAPPWMAAGGDRTIRLDALPSLRRRAFQGWQHLGLEGFFHTWNTGRDWTNKTAAMPSLHAAFALFVVVFFWTRVPRWARWLMIGHPILMGVALVYLAEHYVIDVLAGWAVVAATFAIWARLEDRTARHHGNSPRPGLMMRGQSTIALTSTDRTRSMFARRVAKTASIDTGSWPSTPAS